MTQPTETPTRRTVRAYHDAWIAGNVADAGATLADEVTNPTALNNYSTRSSSRSDYLDALTKFRAVVTGWDLISELYGAGEATLVYDVHTTTPVGTIRTAEHFRLTNGLISTIILIIDATPWHAMQASATGNNQPGQISKGEPHDLA